MNTFSHYVSDTPNTHQGLGRIPLRLMPAEPTKRRRVEHQLPATPRSRLLPTDKSTLVPRRVVKTPKKTKPQPKPKANTKTKPQNQTSPKNQAKHTTGSTKGNLPMLAGTYTVGGLEVKKTHVAMVGGGIAGGLLLWKILF